MIRRLLIISLCMSLFTSAQAMNELPDLGSPASLILSTRDEQNLSRQVMNEISQSLALSKDPVVNDYLHAIGYRIIATHRSNPKSYTFFAIEDNSINAFAVPGGSIGVNTGLILAAQSESELAGVIAHEVAHVHLQHIARFIEHMGRVRLSNIAGVIASVILATQNPNAGTGALAATMASSTQSLINFTRENEKEADLVGIQSLAEAGFDPNGMANFFKRLGERTRYHGSYLPEYLRTHPLTESRLMEAQRRAQNYPYRQVKDSLQFHLIQARIKAHEFVHYQDAIKHFESALQNRTFLHEQGTKYGYALALLRGNDARALTIINELIAQNPNQPLYFLAKSEALALENSSDEATQLLESALKDFPQNHPMTMALADFYIQDHPTDAIRLLHKQSLERPHDPNIYHKLSLAYMKTGNKSSAHFMEAEYRFELGDLYGALTQIRMAQALNPTKKQKQQLAARRLEIEDILSNAR